jgi:hypothetical protein
MTAIPFAVYGLAADFTGRRGLASVGRHAATINLVALDHGDRHDAAAPWVEVGMTGPLHGSLEIAGRAGSWSMDPLPVVISELLSAAGREFVDGDELRHASDRVLAREPQSLEMPVDGKRIAFRRWLEGHAWAAVCDLPPDHLLYVVGRNIDPTTVELSSHVELHDYLS